VSVPAELAPDLWRWTARHPGTFGAEIASFALAGALDRDPWFHRG
jgi:hypothetical protein